MVLHSGPATDPVFPGAMASGSASSTSRPKSPHNLQSFTFNHSRRRACKLSPEDTAAIRVSDKGKTVRVCDRVEDENAPSEKRSRKIVLRLRVKNKAVNGEDQDRTAVNGEDQNQTAGVVSVPEVKQSQVKDNNGRKKKEKEKKGNVPKVCVSLSRMEIEEDIFAMTGSKPSRRPKKRAKHVQKELDILFPGLWLHSISVDDYRVPDTHTKV